MQKKLLLSAAALGVGGLLLMSPIANAAEPTGYKVTGGGQIIAEEASGAGDTVGFNAQELEGDDPRSTGDDNDLARGQFQYVPRGQSAGGQQEATTKFHGVVTCLLSGAEAVANETAEGAATYEEELVAGNARFGGYLRDDPTKFFTVDVTDNGQGGNAEDDLILVRFTAEPCADNPENEQMHNPEDLLRLGRGNVKIHNNPDTAAASVASPLAGLLG